MPKSYPLLVFWIGFLTVTAFNACKVDKSFIPSYIEISKIDIDASSINGNNIHDIKAIQVYVNNQTVGTFPIPCKFPIDASGKVEIQATAFVKINGNSQTLVPFRSLNILKDTLTVEREKTTSWQPQFTYRNNVEIVWQEDFEDSSATFVPIRKDSLDYTRIELRPFNLNNIFTSPSLVHVSRFADVDTFRSMDFAYFSRITSLPSDGRDAILEFDINTALPVLVAVRRFSTTQIEYVPYVTVNATNNEWKRFYINLIYEIQGQPANTQYEIFFSLDKPQNFEGSTEFLIDNIRLSYLK
jgi:hypothetical protein